MGVAACDNTELDLQDNPNAVTPDRAEVDFLYNSVVLKYAEVIEDIWIFTANVSRMRAMTGGNLYANAFSPASFNAVWNDVYADFIPDVKALLAITEERGLDIHSGTAKIMQAYVLMALVDIFGNVPFSQAGAGADNLSPGVDDGASIYAAAETLLDEAIAQLKGSTAAKPANDLFYAGNVDRWVTAANTLKLRAALTTRLVDGSAASKINALISGGDLIDNANEDFQFQYGTERSNPNSRHPLYNDSYETTDGDYMSNYYMWLLWDEKEIVDPRIRYYFYRQELDLSDEDPNIWECVYSITPDPSSAPDHYTAVQSDLPYCITAIEGYFGRDHGNNQGIPPDGPIRTMYGLYPVGGRFDDNSAEFTQNSGTDGALGGGIQPILLSSFVDFMRAEAALTLGTSDNAQAMLESGIRKSMAKVKSFGSKVDLTNVVGTDLDGNPITAEQAFGIDDEAVQDYVDKVMELYNDAANDDERLDIIIKEYLIALWGNGLEAYNAYRRTGKPGNVQPTLEPNPGSYIRSALYPADFVNLNSSVSQKSTDDRVFWDDGSADLY